jgi:hypothetical protein
MNMSERTACEPVLSLNQAVGSKDPTPLEGRADPSKDSQNLTAGD